MKLSLFGRSLMALFASLVLGLGMTACGGGTIGYMWVLGQEYNQIVGFKVDEYSGNLTEVPAAPFASNGSMPVSLVVKSGGRYVYVINQGVGEARPVRDQDSRSPFSRLAATAHSPISCRTRHRDMFRSGPRWTPADRICLCWTSTRRA
jgi:hypothetical protein